MILQLPERDDTKRGLKSEALTITMAIGHQRWLIDEQMQTAVPPTLLIILALAQFYLPWFWATGASQCHCDR
jgi:hypothetical protein